MKLKRKLKKLFFYDRSFIRMICFLIVLIFVLVLGNSFGFVSADDNTGTDLDITGATEFMSYSGYISSSLYDSSYPDYQNYFISSPLGSENISDIYTNITNYVSFNVSGEYPNYIILTSNNYSDNMNFDVVFYDDDTVFGYSGGGSFFSANGSGHEVQYFRFIYNGGNISPNSSGSSTGHASISNFDNDYQGYTFYYVSTSNIGLQGRSALSNKSIYAYDNINYSWGGNDTGPWNTVWYLWHKLNNVSGYENTFHDINYYVSDGLIGGSGGGSNETSANNLYMRDSKWSFSIPKWSNLTSYSGNATFSASLNDFQQDNLSDFYIRFTFNIYTTQSYVDLSYGGEGSSGGGHGTDVLGTGSQYTGYYNYIFSYKDSTTNNKYVDVTLQDFYNMGSSKSFMTLNGIFDRCYKVGFSGNMSDTKFLDWYSDAVSSSSNTTTKATLYCYATLYDSNGDSSGNCTYYYDLLNGSSGVTDSSMSINNNPYVDEDGNVSTTLPDGESSTEDSYNGNGVNVTQTVTVNNDSGDSKSWLWTLISSLISTDDENVSQAGMSDTLVNFVGINPWISLMSTTFGFIPATIWTTLSACFIVVLGILVVAFVLRIILDLL